MASNTPVLRALDLPTSGARAWPCRLAPSLADLFFIAVIICLFVLRADGWTSLLGDGDTGWHIRTGEYILEHHRVPYQDLFSFTRPGATWYAWEWLSDVVFALLFRWAGLKALVVFAAACIAALALLLLRFSLWRGADVFAALLLCLLGIGSSGVHFLVRPHLFTLLLFTISMWMLEADRRRPGPSVWLLIPLTALWTNLHGGFVALLAALALLIVGSAVESRMTRASYAPARRYGLLALGCALASLLNPYGWRLHAHILEYLHSDFIRTTVQEFQAPAFRTEGQLQFEILLLGGLLLAGQLIRKRRIARALWILYFGHCALTSVRHIPLYVIAAVPLLASEVSAVWAGAAARFNKNSAPRLVWNLGRELVPGFRRSTLWAACALAALAVALPEAAVPKDFPASDFPAGMVHRHPEVLRGKRVFTTDQWSDYLIYTFYPRQHVFVDGRSDFYGPVLAGDLLTTVQGGPGWRSVLDRYRFDAALLPRGAALVSLLAGEPEWTVVEDDGTTILLQRHGFTVQNAPLAGTKESPAHD